MATRRDKRNDWEPVQLDAQARQQRMLEQQKGMNQRPTQPMQPPTGPMKPPPAPTYPAQPNKMNPDAMKSRLPEGDMGGSPALSMYAMFGEQPAAQQAPAPSSGWQGMTGGKPGDYVSQYQEQMQNLFNQISNRPAFQYDVNADTLYQQYKDQYTRLGNMAMQDTMGQAAAMTGGYGNTYAATAGNQAYQGYLQQLNDRVPELEARAFDRYRQEGQDMYNLYGLTAQADDTAYGRYADSYNRWLQEEGMAFDQYRDARNFDYGKERDSIMDSRWQTEFDYGKERDSVMDNRWQTEFDYGKTQDTQQQSNWQAQFDYGKTQDTQQQSNWQAQFDYQRQQSAPAARGGGGGGGGRAPAAFQFRESDKLGAADAFMRGGVSGLDDNLRMLESNGVPATELIKLRNEIMSKYKHVGEENMTGERPIGR